MKKSYYIEFETYKAAMDYVEEFCNGDTNIIHIDDEGNFTYIDNDDIKKYEHNEGVIVQDKKKDYEVFFINSADSVSTSFIYATSKDDAARRIKRNLGSECKCIMDIYEI